MKKIVKGDTTGAKDGFTMIELVAVLLIVAILAAFAVARMADTASYDYRSRLEVVKNHLRYAQSRAMASGREWGVRFNSETTYYLFDNADPATPVPFLGENGSVVDLADENSRLRISSAPLTVLFDPYGSPGDETVTIVTNAPEGGTINVTKHTGYIQ
ncbi:MAG: hypothetical protein AVO39_09980 [delta proteobacterium MLS_D]|nr:MAG: hypothetical protein AVO39_09980 [delta proteobacterium MLS_D]